MADAALTPDPWFQELFADLGDFSLQIVGALFELLLVACINDKTVGAAVQSDTHLPQQQTSGYLD